MNHEEWLQAMAETYGNVNEKHIEQFRVLRHQKHAFRLWAKFEKGETMWPVVRHIGQDAVSQVNHFQQLRTFMIRDELG